MNVLHSVIFTLLLVVVDCQDYACPENTVIGACVVGPNFCLYDSSCHQPGDRCCSWGCGGECRKPVKHVAGLCPAGKPAEDGSGTQLFCGRGPTRVDCPSGHTCNIDPADAYAVCCPDPTCRNQACAADSLCYMNQVQCVTTPCPALPTCYTHPCKNKDCGRNKTCFLTGGCDGLCEATAYCAESSGSLVSTAFFTTIATALMSLACTSCIGFH